MCSKLRKIECVGDECEWITGKGCRKADRTSPVRTGRSRTRTRTRKASRSQRRTSRRHRTSPSHNSFPKGDCIERSLLPLKDYQKTAIRFINNPDNRSLLVVFGTGTGKTLTALVASQCFLDNNPGGKVIVVSPASVIDNFEKEMKKYAGKSLLNSRFNENYKFYSFSKFSNLHKNRDTRPDCKNIMLIIDEAHNVRNDRLRFKSLVYCAKNTQKTLLLTATPFINRLYDFNNLIDILYGTRYFLQQMNMRIGTTTDTFDDDLEIIRQTLLGKVIYLDEKLEYYPSVKLHKISTYMSDIYYKMYEQKLTSDFLFGENPSKFYHGYRRAVNINLGEGSEYFNNKIENLIKIVKKRKNNKRLQTVIFTNWIKEGLSIIANEFNKKIDNNGKRTESVKYKVIQGDVPASERMSIVEEFNEEKFQVLIITKAGAEGIDLKGTRQIIILDPVWSSSVMDQIMGRGIRFKSHIHLPLNERTVDVYFLILKTPPGSDIESGDEILYEIISNKKRYGEYAMDMLKSISI